MAKKTFSVYNINLASYILIVVTILTEKNVAKYRVLQTNITNFNIGNFTIELSKHFIDVVNHKFLDTKQHHIKNNLLNQTAQSNKIYKTT